MRHFQNLILFIALMVTYIVMFYWFSALNLFALAPWDTAIFHPEIGTWQRTLNDFFDLGFGQWLVIMISATAFGIPILKTLRRRWDASLRVIVANLLFILLGYGMVILASMINRLFFPIHYGEITDANPFLNHSYARSIIPLIIYWLSYFIWYLEIKSLGKHTRKAKNKAKNTTYHQAVKHLSDTTPEENDTTYQDTLASSQQVSTQ